MTFLSLFLTHLPQNVGPHYRRSEPVQRSLDMELWGARNSRASNKKLWSESVDQHWIGVSIICDILGQLSPTTLFTIKRAEDGMQGLSPSFLIHIAVGHQERDYNFVSAWLAHLDISVT